MPTSVKITTDSKIVEVSEEQENQEIAGRQYDYRVLYTTQHWKFKKYTLTLTFPDRCEETDKFNPMATLIYRHLRHPNVIPDDYICGTAYISNETEDDLIDFTKDDFNYRLGNMLKHEAT